MNIKATIEEIVVSDLKAYGKMWMSTSANKAPAARAKKNLIIRPKQVGLPKRLNKANIPAAENPMSETAKHARKPYPHIWAEFRWPSS